MLVIKLLESPTRPGVAEGFCFFAIKKAFILYTKTKKIACIFCKKSQENTNYLLTIHLKFFKIRLLEKKEEDTLNGFLDAKA